MYTTGCHSGVPKLAVHLAHELRHLAPQLGVGRHALARRHGDLHEGDPPTPGRGGLEQAAEGPQALGDALRVVEPIDRDDELATVVPVAQVGDAPRRPSGRRWSAGPSSAVWMPMGRAASETVRPSTWTPSIWLSRPEHLEQRASEVVQVAVRLEGDRVRAEQTQQDVLALGQDAEDLGRGERDVQEEADAGPRRALPQQPRHEHELVVVHPDQVARLACAPGRRRRSARWRRGRRASSRAGRPRA